MCGYISTVFMSNRVCNLPTGKQLIFGAGSPMMMSLSLPHVSTKFHNYVSLITDFLFLSKADNQPTGQWTSRFLWNMTFHYRLQNIMMPNPTHPEPAVYSPRSNYLYMFHSAPKSSKWSPSFNIADWSSVHHNNLAMPATHPANLMLFLITYTVQWMHKILLTCHRNRHSSGPAVDIEHLSADSRNGRTFRKSLSQWRPPLWSSGQSSWLQIRRPGFDSRHYQKNNSGPGTGSTQPREYNWGATW
jgi:hypothetical protein